MKRKKVSDDDSPDLVVLRLPDEGIVVYGQLHVGEDAAMIEGIAERLTYMNQKPFKLRELEGFSSKRGQFWAERLTVPSSSCSGDERVPSTIRLTAHILFWGDFDPRSTSITRADLSLGDFPPLAVKTPVKLKKIGEHSFFEDDREVLLETEEFSIQLVGRYKDSFNLSSQALVVEFATPRPYTKALELLEQSTCLIGLLTASTLPTQNITYTEGMRQAHQWRSAGLREQFASWAVWLKRPGAIVTQLKDMMRRWIEVTARPYVLHHILVFLGAPPRETMEGLLLTYCQGFEDLNEKRKPMPRLMVPEKYQTDIVDVLSPVVATLGNSDLRGRLMKSIRDANRASLEDRLRAVFAERPSWLWRVEEMIPNVLNRIAARRNDLSHGDPVGSVHTQDDANRVNLQSSLMFLFCLSEIFLSVEPDEKKVAELVDESGEAAHVVWLAGEITKADRAKT